jgi:uncharacterized membrane protein
MIYLTAYFSTLVVFVLCDMAWLVTMASRLYRPTLRDIMLTDVNLSAGFAFLSDLSGWPSDLRYPSGVEVGSLAQATLGGALLGFFTYMTYDLTNQATLELDYATHTGRCRLGNAARRDRGHSGLLADDQAGGLTPELRFGERKKRPRARCKARNFAPRERSMCSSSGGMPEICTSTQYDAGRRRQHQPAERIVPRHIDCDQGKASQQSHSKK